MLKHAIPYKDRPTLHINIRRYPPSTEHSYYRTAAISTLLRAGYADAAKELRSEAGRYTFDGLRELLKNNYVHLHIYSK